MYATATRGGHAMHHIGRLLLKPSRLNPKSTWNCRHARLPNYFHPSEKKAATGAFHKWDGLIPSDDDGLIRSAPRKRRKKMTGHALVDSERESKSRITKVRRLDFFHPLSLSYMWFGRTHESVMCFVPTAGNQLNSSHFDSHVPPVPNIAPKHPTLYHIVSDYAFFRNENWSFHPRSRDWNEEQR